MAGGYTGNATLTQGSGFPTVPPFGVPQPTGQFPTVQPYGGGPPGSGTVAPPSLNYTPPPPPPGPNAGAPWLNDFAMNAANASANQANPARGGAPTTGQPSTSTDPAMQAWLRANPGQTPNPGPNYNPNPAAPAPIAPAGAPPAATDPAAQKQFATIGQQARDLNQAQYPAQYANPAPTTPAPSPASAAPAAPASPPPANLADTVQGTQPISAEMTQQTLNAANADALGGAVTQNDQARADAAGRGFGMFNPALIGQQNQNLGAARGQVAQNNLQIPLASAQYNAAYGLSGGQLGELIRSQQAQEQLGLVGTTTERVNALLHALGQF